LAIASISAAALKWLRFSPADFLSIKEEFLSPAQHPLRGAFLWRGINFNSLLFNGEGVARGQLAPENI
jgi:hypothetical protein